MTSRDQFRQVQAACGLPLEQQDGIPGAQSDGAYGLVRAAALAEYRASRAIPEGSAITGSKGDFAVEIVGPDLWVKNVRSTCFGGDGDSMDSGATASGYSTKGHPLLKAVSLPMNYRGPSAATRAALEGSPIPMMPFGLHADGSENRDGCWVEVRFGNGASATVPCIDLGPNIARYPKNAIDCTIALARLANPLATANNFEAVVSYRIINGVKYLPT